MCKTSCQISSDDCKHLSRTTKSPLHGNMKNTSLLLLTVWAVSGAYISMLFTGVATFTNKWVFTKEVTSQEFPNATLKLTVREYSGLIEACRISVSFKWELKEEWIDKKGEEAPETKGTTIPDKDFDPPRCKSLRELSKGDDPPKDVTSAVIVHVSRVLPLPIVSFFLMGIAASLSTIGLFYPSKRCFIFFCGAVSIIAGLLSLSGLIRYIIAVSDGITEKTSGKEGDFQHSYGYSFVFGVMGFLITDATGIGCLYLYIKLEKMALQSERERRRHQMVRSPTGHSSSPDSTQDSTLQMTPLRECHQEIEL
ncbi:voltage-dependent calcium channel gamma-7 subunit-like [Amphiura filiformis]|uniref:voltage-dependent calcium channel gamma-7 subunit-like n=1 Tax=Amphiura filiformis TaxID=82378 RepID=UPI003B20E6D3